MEFSFIEVGDSNLTIKELHKRFFQVNFDIGLGGFTSILKAIIVVFLLHFGSCPAEARMIWLTKQMNTLFNQSFRGVFVFRGVFSPTAFPILEQPFCRAHVSISS